VLEEYCLIPIREPGIKAGKTFVEVETPRRENPAVDFTVKWG